MSNPATRDKEQALHDFWSGFGLTAYDENSVPDNAMSIENGHYLTYNVSTAALDEPLPLTASLWYRDMSWAAITQKANAISEAIGLGGVLVPYAGGAIWICRGSTFSQRLADDDNTIRRIYLNVMAEYLSAN